MFTTTLAYATPTIGKGLAKVEKGLRGTYIDVYISGMIEMSAYGTIILFMILSLTETQTIITFLYLDRPHSMNMRTYELITNDTWQYVAYYFIWLGLTGIYDSMSFLTGGRDIP